MTMLSLIPEPYRLLARLAMFALIAIALYATGRHHGAERVRGQWNDAVVKQSLITAETERAYRQREQSMLQQVQKAQYDAAQRETALRAAADAASASAGSLRNDLAAVRGRLSAATAEACRATASASLELLGTCADEYRGVAEAADRHASDTRTLIEAWPQ